MRQLIEQILKEIKGITPKEEVEYFKATTA